MEEREIQNFSRCLAMCIVLEKVLQFWAPAELKIICKNFKYYPFT